jgi:arsenite methyltransferase
MNTTDEQIKSAVCQTYGDVVRRLGDDAYRSTCGGCGGGPASNCCGSSEASGESTGIAALFYSAEDIAHLPGSVTDTALGNGNPLAHAGLQPGEVVLDLGSGGGIDCFLAARQVGPEGRAIGLDMTPEMVRLARRNAKKVGAGNVEFRYGEMEDIPLPDESVDVIISNCVINLSPDKDAVFREAYRVLRPSGRISVSDSVARAELPQSARDDLSAWAGCVAGAMSEETYSSKLRAAGFEGIEIVPRDPIEADGCADCGESHDLTSKADVLPEPPAYAVFSARISARKPA